MGWLEGAGRWDETAAGARFAPMGMAGVFALTADDGRLQVRLEPLPGRAGVDVSVQPAVLAHAVARSAHAGGVDPDAAAARVARAVAALVERHGLAAIGDGGLLAHLGAASFPLLAPAYEAGRPPLAEIPRWAAPALRHRQARRAAEALFAPATSRRVVSALARRLLDPGPPTSGDDTRPLDLFGVGVAHCGAVSLDADRLADLLARPGPPVDPTAGPDVDTVRRARRLLAGLPPARVASWLGDVLAADDPPAALTELVDALLAVGGPLPTRLPTRRHELVVLCRSVTPLDPRAGGGVGRLPPRRTGARRNDRATAPPAAATPPTDHGRGRAHVHLHVLGRGHAHPAPAAPPPPPAAPTPPRDPRDIARHAPAATERARATASAAPTRPLPRPSWAAAVDGIELGAGVTLELARSAAELAAWGQLLHNCLADYGPAAIEGRSVLIGVRRHGPLVACAEVTATGELRQLLGPGNRRAPDPIVAAVFDHLTRVGALSARSATNAAWRTTGV